MLLVLLTFFGQICHSEPVTVERIQTLPAPEQAAWMNYWQMSQKNATQDAEALTQELKQAGLTTALRAPDGGDFKLAHKTEDPWYGSPEATELTEVILSYQTTSGGWSKHTGYSKGKRVRGMQWSSQYEPGKRPHYLATFDNHSTTDQIQFLANVWLATKRQDCEHAVLKGIDFLLAAQFPNGGWPQVYPLEGDYHDAITFNDDAMINVLNVLQSVSNRDPEYALVDEARREQATAALRRGIACIQACQIRQNGEPTAWCAQHDPITLAPSQARALEPPSLSGLESSHILKFLMTIPMPDESVVATIDSGLKWLERVKVEGLTQTKVNGKTTYIQDPNAMKVYWARFYDLRTSKPVFPGRNGQIYDSFEAMAAENSLGYDYYTSLPNSILTTSQKKWRKSIEKR